MGIIHKDFPLRILERQWSKGSNGVLKSDVDTQTNKKLGYEYIPQEDITTISMGIGTLDQEKQQRKQMEHLNTRSRSPRPECYKRNIFSSTIQ